MKSKVTTSQIFHVCWFVFFSCLCVSIHRFLPEYKKCLLIGICIFLAVVFLYTHCKDWIDRHSKALLVFSILFLCTMFVGLRDLGTKMLVVPWSDTGTVWFSVADIVETGSVSTTVGDFTPAYDATHTSNHDYFLVYPNSRFMVSFLLPFGYFLDRVLGTNLRSEQAYYYAMIFNSALIILSVVFTALAARREKGNAAALLVVIISALFIPFYLNAYKLYSDTMSMPFVCLAIWLSIEADHALQKALYLRFGSGISVGIAILLKGSVWVLFLALLIYLALKSDSTWKQKLKEIGCLALAVLLVTQAWSLRKDNLPWLDTTQSDAYEIPTMHWIMMASERDGGFLREDLWHTQSFETLDERKSATLEEYIRRVKEHGPKGYLNFLIDKVSMTFADGIYSQPNHLYEYTNKPIGDYVSPYGNPKYYDQMYRCATITLSFIYLGILISGLLGVRRKTSAAFLMNICMFGVILFFSLWESKSRYILNFTLMFILIAVLSIDDLASILKKWKKHKDI